MDSIVEVMAWLACWAALVGASYQTGRIAQDACTAETRRRVSRWLQSKEKRYIVCGWAGILAHIFDSTFGNRHFSLACFRRSAVVSVGTVFVLDLLLSSGSIIGALASTSLFAAVLVTVNIGIDYLSLLETRFAISLIREPRHPGVVCMVLLSDALCTSVIVCLLPIALFFWTAPSDPHGAGIVILARIVLPFMLSTYLTSLWLWLFVAAGLLNKVGEWLGLWYGRVLRPLDVQRKPFLAGAIIGAGLLTVLYVGVTVAVVLICSRYDCLRLAG